jgi:hypothetical protein
MVYVRANSTVCDSTFDSAAVAAARLSGSLHDGCVRSPDRRHLMDDESTFPPDVTDPSSRPWMFRPQGYLVAILADTDEAQRAEAALVDTGIAPGDIKLYTGKEILENHERYMGRRGIVSKAVGAIADDSEGREAYLDYAREDRCAMWVRIPDEGNVPRALRVLADHNYLHARYYGDESQYDFHIS